MLKKLELFHHGYAVLNGFADASKFWTEVLNMLEQLASFLVESMQTVFGLVISAFPGEDVLKDEKNRNLWNPIRNASLGASMEMKKMQG